MEVAAWLRNLGLACYEPAFRANHVDAEVLLKLTAEDLAALGVSSVGHRRKLLAAIAALRNGAGGRSAEPHPEPVTAPAAGSPLPAAERRQLTVLFCDLVGSTELAAELDPEDLREVIGAYHRCVAEVVKRLEGYVAKYMGDGVLAYFGYPQAHEDAAERAVRAGLELVQAVGELKPHADVALQVRVGIATGLVVAGRLGDHGAAWDEEVVGETPNLAARLQELAAPNAVVIGPKTHRLVGGLFEYADLGVQRLRGFAEPVPAWRVRGLSTAEGRFEAHRAAGLTPLVGRRKELARLLDRWQRAKVGAGQVVLLAGEPGIGKSCLLGTLVERLGGEPHTRLRRACSPFHTNSALQPIIDQIERAAGFQRNDTAGAKLDKLEALLAQSAENVAAVAPLFADLLSIPAAGRYPPLDLTPPRRREKLFETLLAQLEELAARRPVLTLWEDVHWIDPTSLEFLGLVVDRVPRLPVLTVITFRPEFQPPWADRAHVTALALSRLGRPQATAMIERVTGGEALPAEVLKRIVARADGVPLYVEELTKAVLESGLLRDAGDHYELSGPLPPRAIPATLQDSLMARLDRLDRLAPAKEVAQIGAALGRRFSEETLTAVAALPEDELRRALDQLVAAGLIFRRGRAARATYVFKHALVQEAAYDSLLRSKRRQLHARIADVLEERSRRGAGAEPELLAHHCTEAGLVERAIGCWREAGRRAVERSASIEAAAHFRKALELLRAQPDSPESRRVEAALQLSLGAALIAPKGYAAEEVRGAYARAEQLCRRNDDPEQLFAALRGLWNCHLLRGELGEASALAMQLLTLARHSEDSYRPLMAYRVVGTSHLQRGDIEAALEHFEQGLSRWDPRRHPEYVLRYGEDPGLFCCAYRARCQDMLGYRDRGLDGNREALALARNFRYRFTFAYALALATTLHQFRREPRPVQRHAEAAMALCEEQGIPQWLAWSAVHRGWALAAQGHGADGIAQLRKGIEAWRAIRMELALPHFLTLLAQACGMTGRYGQGLEALDEAEAVMARNDDRSTEAELHRQRGELILAAHPERTAAAEACFLKAVHVALAQRAKTWELRAATSLARLWRREGKAAEARRLLAPIHAWFTEGFDTQDLIEARALLDDLG